MAVLLLQCMLDNQTNRGYNPIFKKSMNEALNHPYSQIVKILEIDDQSALLELADQQMIKWPISLLPRGAKAGDSLKMIIHDKKTDEEERQRLARTLLNEIMAESPTES